MSKATIAHCFCLTLMTIMATYHATSKRMNYQESYDFTNKKL